MAATEIDLYNDIVTRKLVLGLANAGSFPIGPLFQGEQLQLRWFPLKPTNTLQAPYFTKQPLAGLTLKIAIGLRAGSATPLCAQDVWTVNAVDGCLTAVLDLNTSDLNTAIGSLELLSTLYFEIRVLESGSYRYTYQQQVTINSVVMDPAAAAALPQPAARYYTAAEIDQSCVKFDGNPNGSTIIIPSPDGTAKRLIGCNNDKSPQDEFS